MSEYIVDALWMAEYERGIESLLGIKLEYDGNDNPTPPLPRRNIIVRCRDCKNARVLHPLNPITGIPAGIEDWRCDHFWNADELPEVDPDGFCAWGERK